MLNLTISTLRLGGVLTLLLFLGACQTIDEGPEDAPTSSDPQAPGYFVWHDLLTHDIATARTFYGGLFGWEFEKAEPREGSPYILAKREGRYAGGIIEVPRHADGRQLSRWLGYMSVDSIETAISATQANGGQVAEAMQDLGELGKVTAIIDPQKAVLGLLETRFDSQGSVLRETRGAVVWNELLSSDSDSAADFYSVISGVESRVITRRGGKYTLLESGGASQAGVLQNPLGDTDPVWLSYFAVHDPGALVTKVEALGGKVLLAPSAELREGTMALIQDPDGAILALQKWPL